MRPYEAMYIVDPDLPSEQIEAIVAKYSKIVTDGGGTVVSAGAWEGGRRRMAYEIKGRREGYYILMAFDSTPDVPKELDRIFRISDDCIRHLIVNRVEIDPGRPPQFHPRPGSGEQQGGERRDAPAAVAAPGVETPSPEAPAAEAAAAPEDVSESAATEPAMEEEAATDGEAIASEAPAAETVAENESADDSGEEPAAPVEEPAAEEAATEPADEAESSTA